MIGPLLGPVPQNRLSVEAKETKKVLISFVI